MKEQIFFQREQQQKSVFGDGRVIDTGREQKRNAEFSAGFYINLVHADAVFCSKLSVLATPFPKLCA